MRDDFTLTQKRALVVMTVIALVVGVYFLRRYLLLIAIAASGLLMKFVAHVDIIAVKAFILGLLRFELQPLPTFIMNGHRSLPVRLTAPAAPTCPVGF